MGEGTKKTEAKVVPIDRRSSKAEDVRDAVDEALGGVPAIADAPAPTMLQTPADRGKADRTEKPARETPEQRAKREAQQTESAIAAAREAGMLILLSRVRMHEDPRKHEVVNAVLECGARLSQADRLFMEAGRSFEQIAETLGATLGYLAACDAHRRLPWYRRWFMRRPQFPRFGAHVQDASKPTHEPPPPVVADAEAAKAAALAVAPPASEAAN